MTRARSLATAVIFSIGLAAAPGALLAQSLLNANGLGVPIEALDARSRALGGVGVGLPGPSVLPTDPAAAAGLLVPSVTITFANSWVNVSEGEQDGSAQGARFPMLGVSYPVKTWGTATLSYGGVLDQRWQVDRQHLLPLGSSTARVTDIFTSDGGISALRLGFARPFGSSISAGAAVGLYTGDLTRNLTRRFDSLEVGVDVTDSQIGGFWHYSGFTATLGGAIDVVEALRIGANVTWSGDVEADPSDDTAGSGAVFDFPMEVRVGASGVLTPGLMVAAGLTYADWSTAGEPLRGAFGETAFTAGGGIEFSQASLGGRRMPIRFGYRRSSLPFTLEAGENARESIFSGGFGLDLVQQGDATLAGVGLTLERGSRSSVSLSETFLRASLTLRVSGF
jgi:hypothetical protein